MITVILQEFKTPGNCGAVARVAKNFGCNKLIFLNPRCDILAKESLDRATHAKDLLEDAKIMSSLADIRENFDVMIGTTAQLGSDSNLKRTPVLPEDLKDFITKKTALVIGREGDGLSNDEIRLCDVLCTIPTSRDSPTLNVSHALAVLLYEINKKMDILPDFPSRAEKDAFLREIDQRIDTLDIEDTRKPSMKILWRNLMGKTRISRRELFGLFDFIKKF